MLCMKSEKIKDGENISTKIRTEYSYRESSPKELTVKYGENCILVVSKADFRRTIPCFIELKSALDMVGSNLRHAKDVVDCALSGMYELKGSSVLVFKNGALFEVSDGIVNALKTKYGTLGDWKYSDTVDFLYKNCA